MRGIAPISPAALRRSCKRQSLVARSLQVRLSPRPNPKQHQRADCGRPAPANTAKTPNLRPNGLFVCYYVVQPRAGSRERDDATSFIFFFRDFLQFKSRLRQLLLYLVAPTCPTYLRGSGKIVGTVKYVCTGG